MENEKNPSIIIIDEKSTGKVNSVCSTKIILFLTCLLFSVSFLIFNNRICSPLSKYTDFYDCTSNFQSKVTENNLIDNLQPNFTQPRVIYSQNRRINATLNVQDGIIKGPFGLQFRTRLYNGEFPGPTFRFQAGDTVNILLKNSLGENDKNGADLLNTLHAPNRTNLHVHGMHVSPQGVEDNVEIKVDPNQSFQYSYKIHPEHHCGTSYYHAHNHGSTSVQVAGGMAGAFIVNDKEDSSFTKNISKDLVVMLQSIDLFGGETSFFKTMNHNSTSQLRVDLKNPRNIDYNIMLVNGQYNPKLKITVGEVIRLRIINGHFRDALNLGLSVKDNTDSHAHCQMFTAAYDGVYLNGNSPRLDKSVFIASGSRVDVLVQCEKAGTIALSTVVDKRLKNFRNIWAPRQFPEKYAPNNTQHLITFDVIENKINTLVQVQSQQLPALPNYLAVLNKKHLPGDLNTSLAIEFSGKVDMGINGRLFNPNYITASLKLSNYYQWELRAHERYEKGWPQHPYHQHINHFIMLDSDKMTNGLLYKKGDIRDTIPLYNNSQATMQFSPRDYPGRAMVHCHSLNHEDRGMMAVVLITES